MTDLVKRGESWNTCRGPVTICAVNDPDDIDVLSTQEIFAEFASYRPIVSTKEHLLLVAEDPTSRIAVAFNEALLLVGIALLQPPDPSERWARVGRGIMMEVAVIEVGRNWRSMGISKKLLGVLLEHQEEAERIHYMVGYSWTWDLEGTGCTAIAYRNMMIRLFSTHRFKTFQTNEPNVMMRPENLFMARIGDAVSEEDQKKFKLVRFNVD